MIQRIAVRAIVKKNDKIMFLRRAGGRQSLVGQYELPGDRVNYGEQPEQALDRIFKHDLGLDIQSARLMDGLTYVDSDDRDIQYGLLLYEVSPNPTSKIRLDSSSYSRYVWKSITEAAGELDLTESTTVMLHSLQHNVLISTSPNKTSAPVNIMDSLPGEITLYSDGGSRGNPGPSAAGFVLMNSKGQVIHEGGLYLGITTNNQAEYHGLRIGLEKALEIKAKTVDCRVDSLLVVNQMNGTYNIKNRELWPLHERIKELVDKFDKVTFSHVKRQYNQLADGMVNKILNAHKDGIEYTGK